MRRTEFIDVEHRGFELTDMQLCPDSLLAAMTADETVAESWEDGHFTGMSNERAQDAMACLWHEARRLSITHLNRRFWILNIERTLHAPRKANCN